MGIELDEDFEDPLLEALTKAANQPLPLGILAKDPRKRAMEDALSWLRDNDPNIENVDDPTTEAFSRLTGLQLPKKRSPRNNEKFMKYALDWLRENDPDIDTNLDNPT